MPYGNGMGPEGMGPGTGRRMGYCAGNNRPGCYTPGFGGRGRGAGRGAGFGPGNARGFGRASGGQFFRADDFRRDFGPRGSRSEEEFLREQQEDLELELAAVRERIKNIEEKSQEKE